MKKVLLGLLFFCFSIIGLSVLAQGLNLLNNNYDYHIFNKIIWKVEKKLDGKSELRRKMKSKAYERLADKNINSTLEDLYDDVADAISNKAYVQYGKFCLTANNDIISESMVSNFYKANDPACIPYPRICSNRELGGDTTAIMQYCKVANTGCLLPRGGTISHGSTTVTWNAYSSSSCKSQTRTCNNGKLDGSYTAKSCATINKSCNLPRGGSIADGSSITAWNTSISSSCKSITRNCNNGVLNGNSAYQSMTCASANACLSPWGSSVDHGSSITAYSTGLLPYGSSCSAYSQKKTCNNGNLGFSAGFTYSSCTNKSPLACIIPYNTTLSATINHGTSISLYSGYTSTSVYNKIVSCDNGTPSITNTSTFSLTLPFSLTGSCVLYDVIVASGGFIPAQVNLQGCSGTPMYQCISGNLNTLVCQ